MGRSRGKRPDWLVALAMLVAGCVPFALVVFWPSIWSAVVAGFLFWPFAFLGGVAAIVGEADDPFS